MDGERLKFMGRLESIRIESERLRMLIISTRDRVRDILDPFVSLDELRTDEAAALAIELSAYHGEYVRCLQEMEAIRRALGR